MTQSFLEPVKRILQTTAAAFSTGAPVEAPVVDKVYPKSAKAQQRERERNLRDLAKKHAQVARLNATLKFLYLPQQGLTVAYEEEESWKRVLKVATALTHPHDVYSERLGRMYASANFGRGHFITLRRPKGVSAKDFLTSQFSN